MATRSSGATPDVALDVRPDFPFLEECVYLNTAAAGLSWKGQGQAAARFYDDAKALGFNGMERWRAATEAARERLSRLMRVNPGEIGFASNTTEGLNLVVLAMGWGPGDEIVLAEDEFPSVVRACESAGRWGATVRRVPIASEEERQSALVAALSPKSRLVAASHVHWVTGTRLDLAALSAACHEAGALLLVDGVQAIGAVPMELGETDFYSASVFKWLLSGFGLSILMVRDGAREKLAPMVRGYSNPPPATDLQYAHLNFPGIFALEASLAYMERVGWQRIYQQVKELTEGLMTSLEERGVQVKTPRHTRAGIVSCTVPDPKAVREALASRGIVVEAREGSLRISPHFYNTDGDVQAFLDGLAQVT